VRASGRYRGAAHPASNPYGILPVTSLNAGEPPADQQNQSARDVTLRDFLIRLRDVWRRNFRKSAPRPKRRYRSGKGIDQDLAEVLSMDGQSSSYSMRT